MTRSLERLRDAILRPLWIEDRDQAARRRARTLFGLPFAALAGIVWGIGAAPVMAVGSVLYWSVVGASAMLAFIYLEQRVVPQLAESVAARRVKVGGRWAAVALETAIIGGFILLLTRILGVPNSPGVEVALGFGAFYAATMEVLLGSIPESLASLLRGWGTGGPARRRDATEIDTLISRGRWDEALELCRTATSERPSDSGPYIRMYRILLSRADYEGAAQVLEACSRRASLTPQQDEFVIRQLYEVCAFRLGQGERASELIEEWLDRRSEMAVPEWVDGAFATLAADGVAEEVDESLAPGATDLPPEAFTVDRAPRFEIPADFEMLADSLLGAEDFEAGEGLYGPFWKESGGPTPEEEREEEDR